jgi:hypothetical protein
MHLKRRTIVRYRSHCRSRHPGEPDKSLYPTAFPRAKFARRGSKLERASSAPSHEADAGSRTNFLVAAELL